MRIKNTNLGYRNFLDHILSGELVAGEVITQKELCKILNTSISPLREILVLLEELELIEVKARAGIKIVYPDVTFMRENMQFRTIIEITAMRELIEVASDDWIGQTIEEHLEINAACESGIDVNTLENQRATMDQKFHRDIVKALENDIILKAHERSQSKLQLARHVHKRKPRRQANIQALQEHLQILQGIKDRNVEKSNHALETHFRNSIHRIIHGT